MSYVIANTQNSLGRRNLGRLRGLGWDNIPHPVYPISRSVARLNGLNEHDGAVTYRIDPRTGQYQFYRTDIKPRGVFVQNTFQHPAPPVMSALGLRVLPIGKSVTASTMRGLGCGSCGGRCAGCLSGPRFALGRRRRFMGDDTTDTHIDPNSGGVVDSDGVLLTLPCGPGGQQLPTSQCPKNSSNIPGASDPGLVQQLIAAGKAAATPGGVVVQIAPQNVAQPASWWDQKTLIGGSAVSNPLLAAGAVGFAFLLSTMGGKRR